MGLSSLPAASEGVFLIIIVNTALSIAIFKEIVRSILHVFGIRPMSPETGENLSEQFEISPFAEQFRYRIPAVRFGSFFRCPVEQQCSVCLTRFEPDSEVNRLTCGHFFHKVCLEKWLGYWNITCPLCRTPFLPDEDSTLSCPWL